MADYMDKSFNLKPLSTAKHMTEEEIAAEQQIIEASKKDVRVFGKLYDKYFEGIFQFIYRRIESEEVTSDLTSQTFLKALQNLKKYEFRGLPFSAWLYRIASNEVNRFYNKKKRNKVFSLEEERVFELLDLEDSDFSEEQIQLLIKTLKELPTETVEILELRFFEGKSFKEISFILNIGESGAKMRLYRAVEKLKKHFKVNWKE